MTFRTSASFLQVAVSSLLLQYVAAAPKYQTFTWGVDGDGDDDTKNMHGRVMGEIMDVVGYNAGFDLVMDEAKWLKKKERAAGRALVGEHQISMALKPHEEALLEILDNRSDAEEEAHRRLPSCPGCEDHPCYVGWTQWPWLYDCCGCCQTCEERRLRGGGGFQDDVKTKMISDAQRLCEGADLYTIDCSSIVILLS